MQNSKTGYGKHYPKRRRKDHRRVSQKSPTTKNLKSSKKVKVLKMPNTSMSLLSKTSSSGGIPSAGEAFTVTCYTCGMPSSKEWAQRVRSRPSSPLPLKPYYPFLLQLRPPTGAILHEDGSAFLCAFCHASLEAQWNAFEKGQGPGSAQERAYNVHKFICAVCSVETYRKRVRALPFQEFPFLAKERQPGSLTLGNNPLAIVCLDCSETLWSQSAEYDRWGLPIQKRHFNWMLRQPPPENSMEATVARLPSGETQLPRCPPTEPLVIPRRKESRPLHDSSAGPALTYRIHKNSKSESHGSKSPSSRKSSTSSSGPPELTMSSSAPTVPVVTVAPWASHSNAAPTSVRKDSVTVPMSSGTTPKYDSQDGNSQHSDHSQPGIYTHSRNGSSVVSTHPPPFLTTPSTFGNFHWSGRDIVGEPFHFQPSGLESRVISAHNTNWSSWLPPSPQADLLRYQTYLSSLGNRSFSVHEPFYNPPPHTIFSVPTSTEILSVHPTEPQPHPAYIPSSNYIPTSNAGSPQHLHHPHSSASTNHESARAHPKSSLRTTPEKRHGNSSSDGNGAAFPNEPQLSPVRRTSRMHESVSPGLGIPRKSSVTKFGKISDHHRRTIAHINPKKGITKNNYLALAEAEGERLRNLPMGLKKSVDRMKRPNVNVTTTKHRPVRASWPATNSESSVQTEPIDYCATSPVKQDWTDSAMAMDLSVPAVKSATPNNPVPPVPKRPSNFNISFLCGEPSPSIPVQESRDSVIVSMLQSGVTSPKPVLQIAEPFLSRIPEGSDSEIHREMDPEPAVATTPKTPPMVKPESEPVPESASEAAAGIDKEFQELHVTTELSKTALDTDADMDTTPATTEYYQIEKPKELVIVNEREFVENAIAEFRKKLDEKFKAAKDAEDEKKGFLNLFDLVTVDKKSEIELNTLERRFSTKSLPPLKLRPNMSPTETLSEDLEKNLFLTAFEDPSLKHSSADPDQLRFMSRLGLKQASRTEKYRREQNWRLMLTERMLREKRGPHLVGEKRPWDNYIHTSKHLLPSRSKLARRNSTGNCMMATGPRPNIPMRSLSVTLPPMLNDYRSSGIHSTDLLTTVESRNHALAMQSGESDLAGDSNSMHQHQHEPVITYPKYIPSYAVGAETTSSQEIPEPEPEKMATEPEPPRIQHASVLNVPTVPRNYSAIFEAENAPEIHEPPKKPLPNICNIPKIPVLKSTATTAASGGLNTGSSEESPDRKINQIVNPNNNHRTPSTPKNNTVANNLKEPQPQRRHLRRNGVIQWPGVEPIIQRCNFQWKETKEEIESLLKTAALVRSEDKARRRISSELKRLRKNLSSQQAEMKIMVKRLKRK